MGRYALRRLVLVVPILWVMTVIAFALISLAPGDAVDVMVLDVQQGGGNVSAAGIANRKHQLGLDQPAPVRYVVWLGTVLQGNLGRRLADGLPVGQLLSDRLPRTVELMGAALGLGLLIGLPLGAYSALHQYSILDNVMAIFAFFGISIPSFFAAVGALYIFAVVLHILPVSGTVTPGHDPSLGETLNHLILPASVLGFASVAEFMRYSRASMLDTLHQEYVTTARSKGLRATSIVLRHVVRNAMLPIITIVGLNLPGLVGGAIIIERLFNWPGIGLLYFTAINDRDYPTMMGIILISGTAVALSNLLADLAYAVADPRIRYQ
jgi:peptide/nickel transport system permease protein